ncbi:hypothetical protein [Olivibacter sp. XZL3]|uniref:hypothetical protein n=1 Tax=Olivibacter sp. XZL3 TaxID=1735116 RepID=UPI0010650E0D|nr:hypothetical protein [Olivibacter sp. XZL3]
MSTKNGQNANKLIAWNFATTAAHQHANRKFPRRYFYVERRDIASNRPYHFRLVTRRCVVGKMTLEDTEAASSKALAVSFILQYPSRLRK